LQSALRILKSVWHENDTISIAEGIQSDIQKQSNCSDYIGGAGSAVIDITVGS
jgi:hypothetical protein